VDAKFGSLKVKTLATQERDRWRSVCGLQTSKNNNIMFAQKPGLNLQSFYNNMLQQQQSKLQLPVKDQLNTSSNPQQPAVDPQSSNSSPQHPTYETCGSNSRPQQPTYETCGSGGGSNSTEEVLIIEKPSADELLRQVIKKVSN
jgi:hypothetical protein